jgi:hypothetical protein
MPNIKYLETTTKIKFVFKRNARKYQIWGILAAMQFRIFCPPGCCLKHKDLNTKSIILPEILDGYELVPLHLGRTELDGV